MANEKLKVIKEKFKRHIQQLKLTFKLEEFKLATIKELALSNIGIGMMASVFILLMVGLHFHNHQSTTSDTVNTAAWNNTIPDDSNADNKPLEAHSPNAKTTTLSIAANDFKNLQETVKNLQQNLAQTNERLMVLTSQVNDEKSLHKKQDSERKPYRLLGVHLDQGTNQWMADVEYNDSVLSVSAGQQFDGWHVKDVNAQGAHIQ